MAVSTGAHAPILTIVFDDTPSWFVRVGTIGLWCLPLSWLVYQVAATGWSDPRVVGALMAIFVFSFAPLRALSRPVVAVCDARREVWWRRGVLPWRRAHFAQIRGALAEPRTYNDPEFGTSFPVCDLVLAMRDGRRLDLATSTERGRIAAAAELISERLEEVS